ncbi:MAG: thermonuclease family protein [Verrucomicrobia bacterium]|nr:thermonuclease family protein [Verrucomicrobiota bacterium]
MQTFKVTQVIDGDTFVVSPEWNWNKQAGDHVRPTGYNAPELGTPNGTAAAQRLRQLLLGNQIELKNAVKIDRGRLVCDVFLNSRNLRDYFPAYQT